MASSLPWPEFDRFLGAEEARQIERVESGATEALMLARDKVRGPWWPVGQIDLLCSSPVTVEQHTPSLTARESSPLCLLRLHQAGEQQQQYSGTNNTTTGNWPAYLSPAIGDLIEVFVLNNRDECTTICHHLGLNPQQRVTLSRAPSPPAGSTYPVWLPTKHSPITPRAISAPH